MNEMSPQGHISVETVSRNQSLKNWPWQPDLCYRSCDTVRSIQYLCCCSQSYPQSIELHAPSFMLIALFFSFSIPLFINYLFVRVRECKNKMWAEEIVYCKCISFLHVNVVLFVLVCYTVFLISCCVNVTRQFVQIRFFDCQKDWLHQNSRSCDFCYGKAVRNLFIEILCKGYMYMLLSSLHLKFTLFFWTTSCNDLYSPLFYWCDMRGCQLILVHLIMFLFSLLNVFISIC